ncbi:alpha/beta hydrolase [Altibacter sp.]|uniref:alpha/beta hydrolase n=1 Tax=Altibacter sp. TaxID=2024823 RepID=UPI002583A0AF|nr:alpha/beta hydrolase [Altibacter sp.]MCW9037451.1 alpha/beta hydrolase [Altibacter sp.]
MNVKGCKHISMKSFHFLLIPLLVLSFLSVSCSSEGEQNGAQEEQPLLAKTELNVPYGPSSQQVYDLYLPEGRSSTSTKVLVLVHGGGWTGGDKADMQQFVTLLQQEHPNHAIVNMNYVLATLSTPAFPNQFLDIKKVIEKLSAEKEVLQIQPTFGLIGTSAGAHLSLQYDYVYDTGDQVTFVADIVGPTDFTDPFYANDPNFQLALEALVDESAYPPGTNYAQAVSPVFQVSNHSSPSILFYGSKDPLVPLTNGERLQQALSQHDVTNSFSVYEGGHGDDWSAASIADLQTQLSAFINVNLAIED